MLIGLVMEVIQSNKDINNESRKRKSADEDDEENQQVLSLDNDESNISDEELESFLFGKSTTSRNLKSEEHDEQLDTDANNPEQLLSFSISTKPSLDSINLTDAKVNEEVEPQSIIQSLEKKPAWADPDDDELRIEFEDKKKFKKLRVDYQETSVSGRTFQKRLKDRYERVLPAPVWADIDEMDEEKDESDKLFKTTSDLLDRSAMLRSGKIEMTRKLNLNIKYPEYSGITSLEFHPSAKIAFTSSMSKRVNIFQADGEDNKKLQSIFVDGFPISTAHFTNSGNKIVMSSNKKYFYVFDMIGGKVIKVPGLRGKNNVILENFVASPDGKQIAFLGVDGYLHFASTESYQYTYSMKMNGTLKAAAFSKDSTKVYTTGGDGEVYIWDVKTRKCRHRFLDEGSIGSTSLASSNNGKFLSVGSKSGVVNIYQESSLNSNSPKPVKTLMNLTTEIDGVKFNPSSEVMAYYSTKVKNAVKLLHFPSLTTFSAWPQMNENIGYVTCLDFSPLSGYMGIGTDKGNALLYRLNHFPDA